MVANRRRCVRTCAEYAVAPQCSVDMSTNILGPHSPGSDGVPEGGDADPLADHVPAHFGSPSHRIVIFGVGRVGTALARVLLAAGYEVAMVGSGPVEGIELIVNVVAPGAVPMEAAAAVPKADIVILAVPLNKVDSISQDLLAGKVVVDVMNYWEPIDGSLADFPADAPTSPVISAKFAGASVVKALNHIGYRDMEGDRQEPGAPERRALAVAGDDERAVALILEMVHRIGFDAVFAGGLAASAQLESGGPVFGVRLTKSQLAGLLA